MNGINSEDLMHFIRLLGVLGVLTAGCFVVAVFIF